MAPHHVAPAGPRRRRAPGDRLDVRDVRLHGAYFGRLVMPAALAALAVAAGWHAAIVLVTLAFLAWMIVGTLRDRRAAARHPVPLAIGPEGLTTVETGTVAWEDVRRLRVDERWSSDADGTTRTWALELVPDRGRLAGRTVLVESRFLRASLEDVSAAIEAYMPDVIESRA